MCSLATDLAMLYALLPLRGMLELPLADEDRGHGWKKAQKGEAGPPSASPL